VLLDFVTILAREPGKIKDQEKGKVAGSLKNQ
jgi:hypothetical protein